jgi:hypothetical protein
MRKGTRRAKGHGKTHGKCLVSMSQLLIDGMNRVSQCICFLEHAASQFSPCTATTGSTAAGSLSIATWTGERQYFFSLK